MSDRNYELSPVEGFNETTSATSSPGRAMPMYLVFTPSVTVKLPPYAVLALVQHL